MPATTSSLFDFILQLLANPALAQSFLSDPDGTFDGVDLNQTDITIVATEINNAASLLNSSGVASIAIPVIVPGLTGGQLLDSFVTSFYADHPTTSNVWADGDVSQAFANVGGVAVAAGEEVEDVIAAAGGSVAVGGDVDESGIANGGGIAAGGDIEFEENDDITVGDGNVQIFGNGNDVVGGDQINNDDSPGSNIATNGSTIQEAEDGGMNAGVNAIRDSNIAGDDLAVADDGGTAVAADGNVATGTDSVATDGPVADGPRAQAAGEDSNLVKDDDNFNPSVTLTTPVTLGPITQASGSATSGASGASGPGGVGGASGAAGAGASGGAGSSGGVATGGSGAAATSGPATSGSATGGNSGSATGGVGTGGAGTGTGGAGGDIGDGDGGSGTGTGASGTGGSATTGAGGAATSGSATSGDAAGGAGGGAAGGAGGAGAAGGAGGTSGVGGAGGASGATGDTGDAASGDNYANQEVTVNFGDIDIDIDDSDALSSGNQSGAVGDGALIAGSAAIVSQDNDSLGISFGDVNGGKRR